ncbi:S41 family peptidase [Deinococcus soli (ex Cha et al. 2016)]|uniref:Carboxyl-terminal processing protease n=2 Tax=Deinococcus soli (ex Cha et al. 2016) TaxID=1309411 RepID=A0ACC6KH05_9DEIO|nr:S41 family peptidase [Deinococcus soli (ex Cha et al. 2016)]MDR6218950.1 carboxyl-terminal processing protease [Deinococcus soli (ex Cha et al. 2016)]MDR6328747.1 carboxyl-terminal processing protease [Deinococcus soli (ex Cha et al. 2016)]MDR6751766.1 carboxyl-terminal processing protease [Deinococcus soli (ex Cha et al. 2016)]
MKSHLMFLAAALTLSSASAVSPAQRLFNEARTLLLDNYSGLSTVDRPALLGSAQKTLTAACASTGEKCPYTTAFPVIEQVIEDLGDEHSAFQRPSKFSDFQARESGAPQLQYGVSLRDLSGDEQVITDVLPGSAADKAGLRRGDRLTQINGAPYTYARLLETKNAGKPTQLTVRRAGQTLTVTVTAVSTVTRNLPRVTYVGNLAVIRIPTFFTGGGVAQGLHDLLRDAQRNNAKGVLIDLRDNGGGDLTECDMAASAFVPIIKRVAITSTGKDDTTIVRGAYRQTIGVPGAIQLVRNPVLWDGPTAVLVNADSASCSEFFAFELQYAGRARVIGEPTAGVGNTATQVFPLPGNAALQLTTVHYNKPDQTPYNVRVTPDVPGTDDYELLAAGQDTLLNAALAQLTADVAAFVPKPPVTFTEQKGAAHTLPPAR